MPGCAQNHVVPVATGSILRPRNLAVLFVIETPPPPTERRMTNQSPRMSIRREPWVQFARRVALALGSTGQRDHWPKRRRPTRIKKLPIRA